jgi:hypothetical protein
VTLGSGVGEGVAVVWGVPVGVVGVEGTPLDRDADELAGAVEGDCDEPVADGAGDGRLG